MAITTSPSKSFLESIRFFGRQPRAYDLFAASPLLIWYGACLAYQWPGMVRDIGQIDLVHIAPLAALDLLSQSVSKRVIAFFGCYVGIGAQIMPITPSAPWITVLSTFLIVFGMTFAIYSLLWLGRSISIMPESRKLVTGGPYSLVRHPLYVGEQLAVVGVALQCRSAWVLAVLMLQFCCQLYRMMYEEQILTDTFPEYRDYAEQTARLIPWLY
jgi:protein-S-isoprenylcysteine O-methyltransferase Ste14